MVILPANTALLGMEKEEQKAKTFKLISTDNIEHKVSSADLMVSKTLSEMVEDRFFDRSKSIPVDLKGRVLGLLVSCMEKVSAIDSAEDKAAYNQKVVSALDPLFIKDSSKNGLIGGISLCPDNVVDPIFWTVK